MGSSSIHSELSTQVGLASLESLGLCFWWQKQSHIWPQLCPRMYRIVSWSIAWKMVSESADVVQAYLWQTAFLGLGLHQSFTNSYLAPPSSNKANFVCGRLPYYCFWAIFTYLSPFTWINPSQSGSGAPSMSRCILTTWRSWESSCAPQKTQWQVSVALSEELSP